jgi:predicted SAM-dependent methyltransferase
MKYLNLGCGSRYSTLREWKNIDFVSRNKYVIGHNLMKGIPFEENSFDVVYHSHVLEHFTKDDGNKFLLECYRVLTPGGMIRIAVPDLERIAREYLKNLEQALKGDIDAMHNYEWIKLELYDQVVRNVSGGNMAKYIFQEHIPNEEYVYERFGEEGRSLRKSYLEQIGKLNSSNENSIKVVQKDKYFPRSIVKKIKRKLKELIFQNEIKHFENLKTESLIGKFRLGGEIHQWMYDRFSLSKLLGEIGFSEMEVKDAFTSKIQDWNKYELESKNGIIYKPDSLFMEATK